MKLLLLSDTHLRTTCPAGRKDDFRATQHRKWQFIIDTAIKEEISYILQAGDLFDTPSPSLGLITEFINFLTVLHFHRNIEFLTIPGQHDLLMRNADLSKTAMGVLESAGLLKVIPEDGLLIEQESFVCVFVYGKAFGCKDIEIDNKKMAFKILVVHDMIGDKPLYPGQEITSAKTYLKKYDEFDLILCGDYHYPFWEELKGRIILNTGCLLRLTRNEEDMNRTPHFYILDIPDLGVTKLKKYDIPIDPPESVFLTNVHGQKSDNSSILALIEKLKQKGVGIGYLQNLETYYQEHEVPEAIKILIAEALQ